MKKTKSKSSIKLSNNFTILLHCAPSVFLHWLAPLTRMCPSKVLLASFFIGNVCFSLSNGVTISSPLSCAFRCSAAMARTEDCASFAASLSTKTTGCVIAEQREYFACPLQASAATVALPEVRERGLSVSESVCAACG